MSDNPRFKKRLGRPPGSKNKGPDETFPPLTTDSPTPTPAPPKPVIRSAGDRIRKQLRDAKEKELNRLKNELEDLQ